MSQKLNFSIDAKTDFKKDFDVLFANGLPISNTGFTANSSIKKSYTSVNYTATFQTQISDGVVTLSLSKTQTANIAPGRYLYDIIITDSSNNTIRFYEGVATITPSIT